MAPNLTLASPGHPRDSRTPVRAPAAITRPLQELQNGDAKHTAKAAPPGAASKLSDVDMDMDTDGEIDVDDCDDRDDREYQLSAGWNNQVCDSAWSGSIASSSDLQKRNETQPPSSSEGAVPKCSGAT